MVRRIVFAVILALASVPSYARNNDGPHGKGYCPVLMCGGVDGCHIIYIPC